MLAFHGFNRSPDDFEIFARSLDETYTILAFDLFFHGKSFAEVKPKITPLNHAGIKDLLDEILDRYKRDEFEILSYSFGGRLALNCVEIYSHRVKGLYMIAPDGLGFNPGFYFATQTFPGRMLMKKYMQNPAMIIKILNMLASLKIYDAGVINFYTNHLSVNSMRERVYNAWMLHRSTVPDLKNIAKIIRKNNIRVLLFFGRYDMIIPLRLGEKFALRIGKPKSLYILETGHRLLEKYREINAIIKNV